MDAFSGFLRECDWSVCLFKVAVLSFELQCLCRLEVESFRGNFVRNENFALEKRNDQS